MKGSGRNEPRLEAGGLGSADGNGGGEWIHVLQQDVDLAVLSFLKAGYQLAMHEVLAIETEEEFAGKRLLYFIERIIEQVLLSFRGDDHAVVAIDIAAGDCLEGKEEILFGSADFKSIEFNLGVLPSVLLGLAPELIIEETDIDAVDDEEPDGDDEDVLGVEGTGDGFIASQEIHELGDEDDAAHAGDEGEGELDQDPLEGMFGIGYSLIEPADDGAQDEPGDIAGQGIEGEGDDESPEGDHPIISKIVVDDVDQGDQPEEEFDVSVFDMGKCCEHVVVRAANIVQLGGPLIFEAVAGEARRR